VGWLLIYRTAWLAGLQPRFHRLLILALLDQFQLPPEQQDLLLLQGQRIIEGLHRVFLKGELALHLRHLQSEVIDFSLHFTLSSFKPCFRPGYRLIYCRVQHKGMTTP